MHALRGLVLLATLGAWLWAILVGWPVAVVALFGLLAVVTAAAMLAREA